jgi:phenol 2-monooxygenase (NADPH)
MFSAHPRESGDAEGEGVDPEEFQQYFIAQGRFTAGTATRYAPSMITADAMFQHLAEGFPVGMRFHSAPVVRLADGKPVQLPRKGKFGLIDYEKVFCPDPKADDIFELR